MNPAPVRELAFEGPLAAQPASGRLRSRLASLVEEGYPPSVSLGVVSPDQLLVESFGGNAGTAAKPVPTTRQTIYDLASLTKVVCTVTLVMVALQRSEWELSDPVQRWLPGFPNERTTLWHLLTHTSGIVDHRPFFATLDGRGPVEAAVYHEASSAVPGSPVLYSDLNFMLLGWALERCLGQPLDQLFAREVSNPLDLVRTGFCPAPALRSLTAATEVDGDQRRQPVVVWGEVHDGNAFALGGVAGHAGLFAPLPDLCRFARSLLPGTDGPLSEKSRVAIFDRQAGGGDDVRGIGWRLEPPEEWGPWPAGTIWHTGFTGTSLLVSRDLGIGVVLLTNAVHPRRQLERQAAVRAEVHRLVRDAVS